MNQHSKLTVRAHINRWGLEIRKGSKVSAHLARGGTVTGIVRRSYLMDGYGRHITLDNGYDVAADDVFKIEST